MEFKKITAFETKCYRKILLRIPWIEKVASQDMLERIVIYSRILLQKVRRLKLKYFGHIKRHETLEKHILEAKVEDKRGSGRPTKRWDQGKEDWLETTISHAGKLEDDQVLIQNDSRSISQKDFRTKCFNKKFHLKV